MYLCLLGYWCDGESVGGDREDVEVVVNDNTVTAAAKG